MYRLFYNHCTLKDVLLIVINPEATIAKRETHGDVVALYDSKNKLAGINIFHINDTIKIKANGVIFVPGEMLLGIVNDMLDRVGLPPLPPLEDSGFRVAKIKSVKENALFLGCGEEEYEARSPYKNLQIGSIVVIALDGAILADGTFFHKAKGNEARIMSAPELHIEGKEDEAFLLDDDPSFKDGEDFFIR